MDGEVFDMRSFYPQGALSVSSPTGSFGGGSANVFPIILGGVWSLIGYVMGSSVTAINLFKIMVYTGSTSFSYDEFIKSDDMSEVRRIMTTADFNKSGTFHIGQDTGYLDLLNFLSVLRNGYYGVIDAYNRSHPGSEIRGVVANCVSGVYSVRPTWARRSASDPSNQEGQGQGIMQYYLTRLDFGTEAQLATWDGTQYLCDLDLSGSQRSTPVVKRVYIGSCPNSPGVEE